MNILFLGPRRDRMVDFLCSNGDRVHCTDQKITVDSLDVRWADFLICYGYRYIIAEEVLNLFPNQAINLHISYLPYNRGADPNLWSFIDNTPKGVTIHYLSPDLDAGDILAQKIVESIPDDTLRTSYDRLAKAIEDLCEQVWPKIKDGRQPSSEQPLGGTCHRRRDRKQVEYLLTRGWDTPVAELTGKAVTVEQGKSV